MSIRSGNAYSGGRTSFRLSTVLHSFNKGPRFEFEEFFSNFKNQMRKNMHNCISLKTISLEFINTRKII